MKKRIVLLLLLAGIVAAGIYGKQWYNVRFQHGSEAFLNIYGTIDIRDASLAFNEQERLREVLAEEGQQVRQGQVLARLDTNRLSAAIEEIQARIGAQQEVVKRLTTGSRPPGDCTGPCRG